MTICEKCKAPLVSSTCEFCGATHALRSNDAAAELEALEDLNRRLKALPGGVALDSSRSQLWQAALVPSRPDAVVAALSRVNAALADLTIGPLERAAVAKWAARLFEQAELDSSRDSRAVRLRELIEEKLRRHRSDAEPEAPIDRAASKVVGVMLTGLAILFGLLILVPLALFIFGR